MVYATYYDLRSPHILTGRPHKENIIYHLLYSVGQKQNQSLNSTRNPILFPLCQIAFIGHLWGKRQIR